MIKVHKKFIILVTVFMLLIATSFSVWYFFFNKERTDKQVEVLKPKTLSNEEKMKILENLAKMGTTTITEKEKISILNNLKQKSNNIVITNEEKMKILENLNNRN
jgi:aspartate/glutamate racemase